MRAHQCMIVHASKPHIERELSRKSAERMRHGGPQCAAHTRVERKRERQMQAAKERKKSLFRWTGAVPPLHLTRRLSKRSEVAPLPSCVNSTRTANHATSRGMYAGCAFAPRAFALSQHDGLRRTNSALHEVSLPGLTRYIVDVCFDLPHPAQPRATVCGCGHRPPPPRSKRCMFGPEAQNGSELELKTTAANCNAHGSTFSYAAVLRRGGMATLCVAHSEICLPRRPAM